MRAILHCSVLAAGGSNRYTVHGENGSLLKRLPDQQEAQLLSGMRPGAPGWGVDPDDMVIFDGARGERLVSTPAGDQRAFYRGVFGALRHGGLSPVPSSEALAVMAVLEAAFESAAYGRAVSLPLTTEERREFSALSVAG